MIFLLPTGLPAGLARELERACVAGGPDSMPWPTQVRVESGKLTVRRDVDESGTLVVPWEFHGAGRLMGATATLIEREAPYQFRIELARGKVNQIRCQAADWQSGGLQIPDELADQIRVASLGFGRAVTQPASEGGPQAQGVLDQGYQTAEQLVRVYTEQMFAARHQRQPRLEATLGCCLGAADLAEEQAEALGQACNAVCPAFTWGEVEPAESTYNWAPYDRLVKWAQARGLAMVGGPLIDFSTARLPDWLWLWERDLSSIASFMCDYVETAVKRYVRQVTAWQLCAASNSATVLGLGEDELLWLTAKLIEAARQVDPKLELSIGIAQPWGEYMAVEDRTHSPFIFADTLVRSGLNLAALDLELVMGVTPRGSYCRDLLETSRLLDLYTLLGTPLRVTLGYPSAGGEDEQANKEYKSGAGHWHGEVSAAAQADWAMAFAGLALCKPSIRGVQWVHLSDADAHQFPHCGLLDQAGKGKPALQRLRELRENHLR
jgi:hypothetical protein